MNQQINEDRDDPYLVLHLSQDASRQDLKERYYQLTRTFHPDRQPAELYDYAKEQFKRTDEAYKAVSTPFNKFIYDNLGYGGLDLYDKNQAKFLDVEKHFIDQLHIQQEEEDNNVEYQEDSGNNKEYSNKKQEILKRFWHISRLLREEQDHARVYNKVYLNTEINCKNSIKKVIPFTQNKYILSKVLIAPYIGLPSFKGIQSTLGFYIQGQKAPYSKGSERALIALQNAYQFNSPKWYLKELTVRSLIHYQPQGNEFRLEFDKPVSDNMTLSAKGQYYQGNFIPTLSINRNLNDNHNISGDLQFYSNQAGGTLSHTTMLSRKLKMESELNFSAGQLGFEESFTYVVNKRFQLVGGFGSSVQQQKRNELLVSADTFLGFSLNFNKSTHMAMKSHLGYGKNQIEVTITRHKHGWTIPFTFFKAPNLKQTLIILGITGLGSFLGYQYSKMRQNLHIKKLKKEKQSRDALNEERVKLNTIQNDLKQHILPLIAQEIYKPNGLVIIWGYIGHQDQIYKLRKFHRKTNKLPKFQNDEERRQKIAQLLEAQHQLDFPFDVNDYSNQVQDITLLLFASLYMSILKVDFTDYKNIKGLYNPCLDNVKDKPVIYFQYIKNGKIQDKIVHFGQSVTIGANQDRGLSLNSLLLRYF